jgi:hypothetical protein
MRVFQVAASPYNLSVSRRLALALIALSIPILIISLWPAPRTVFSTQLTLPEHTQPVTLTLNHPDRLYHGDADTISLSLYLDSDPFAATDSNPLGIAHMDTDAFTLAPRGEVAQPVAHNTALLWKWNVTASEEPTGGELTLVLRWRLPSRALGESVEQVVWVRSIQIATPALLGLPISLVRLSAFTATLIGLILLTLSTLRPKP